VHVTADRMREIHNRWE